MNELKTNPVLEQAPITARAFANDIEALAAAFIDYAKNTISVRQSFVGDTLKNEEDRLQSDYVSKAQRYCRDLESLIQTMKEQAAQLHPFDVNDQSMYQAAGLIATGTLSPDSIFAIIEGFKGNADAIRLFREVAKEDQKALFRAYDYEAELDKAASAVRLIKDYPLSSMSKLPDVRLIFRTYVSEMGIAFEDAESEKYQDLREALILQKMGLSSVLDF